MYFYISFYPVLSCAIELDIAQSYDFLYSSWIKFVIIRIFEMKEEQDRYD